MQPALGRLARDAKALGHLLDGELLEIAQQQRLAVQGRQRVDGQGQVGRLRGEGSFAFPAGWEPRLDAALDASLARPSEPWSTTVPGADGDEGVLWTALPTQTAEHAARAGRAFLEAMPRFRALLADVVAAHGGAVTAPTAAVA